MVRYPAAFDIRWISLSKTVFPTPRRPGQKKTFFRFANADAAQKHAGLLQDRSLSHKFRRGVSQLQLDPELNRLLPVKAIPLEKSKMYPKI